jgi:hypothetical protein
LFFFHFYSFHICVLKMSEFQLPQQATTGMYKNQNNNNSPPNQQQYYNNTNTTQFLPPRQFGYLPSSTPQQIPQPTGTIAAATPTPPFTSYVSQWWQVIMPFAIVFTITTITSVLCFMYWCPTLVREPSALSEHSPSGDVEHTNDKHGTDGTEKPLLYEITPPLSVRRLLATGILAGSLSVLVLWLLLRYGNSIPWIGAYIVDKQETNNNVVMNMNPN